jgi:arsenate reductase
VPGLAGQPDHGALGVPDPAAVEGTDEQCRRAFRDAQLALESRIKLFVALPIDKLDRMAAKREVDEIGRVNVAREAAP